MKAKKTLFETYHCRVVHLDQQQILKMMYEFSELNFSFGVLGSTSAFSNVKTSSFYYFSRSCYCFKIVSRFLQFSQ